MLARQRITTAVIPAAGSGTRMLPVTKAIPKEMLPVATKPLIQYAIEEAVASGIEMIIVVVRNQASLIRAHFSCDPRLESFLDDQGKSTMAEVVRRLGDLADIQYVEQQEPLGLAHAISCARPLVGDEPFVVLLPDVIIVNAEPVARQLICAQEQHGGSVIAIREIPIQDTVRHGVVQTEDSTLPVPGRSVRVTALVEKPSADQAPSRLGVFGRYLLQPAIWDAIDKTAPDGRGEVQLTDALNFLCRENPIYGFGFQGIHYDAGDRLGYLKANIELSLRDPQLQESVLEYLSTVQNPATLSV